MGNTKKLLNAGITIKLDLDEIYMAEYFINKISQRKLRKPRRTL